MKIDITQELNAAVHAHESGDLETAEQGYLKILSVAPGHADALHLYGLVAFQQGDTLTARTRVEEAIRLYDKAPLYHANLGRILRAADDNAAAVDAYRNAIQLSPEDAALHSDLSAALIALGELDAARARAHLAIELDDKLASAYLNLGLALQALNGDDDQEAETALRHALSLDQGLAGTFLALGMMHQARDEMESAQNAYRAAVQLDPGLIIAHCNLGNIYRHDGELEKATDCYRGALEREPGNPLVLSNLAVTMQEMGDTGAALELYDEALKTSPHDPEIRRNRGMALLSIERFEDGWRDFEYRLQTEYLRPHQREWPVPSWKGEDLNAKSIYVHAEQGYGDTLQFVRFLPLLHNRGARVVFECSETLHSLVRGIDGVAEIVAPGDTLPKVDYHSPLLSLPGHLGMTKGNIPSSQHYLRPPKSSQKAIEKLMEEFASGFRIGIAWRGNPNHVNDKARSPGLAPFLPLLDMAGATVVSLQKDAAAMDLASSASADRIYDPTERLLSFGDTAALIQSLDAVISCDTAVLHLAGALGAPTFALLPHVAEWRWGVSGHQTFWYPAMILCRQTTRGDWKSAVDQAVSGILELMPKASKTF